MHRLEKNTLHYRLHLPQGALELDCRFLESGRHVHDQDRCFSHPLPPFNRIFLFAAGGAHITLPQGPLELVSGHIYLLPINQSFEVKYYQGSELIYFHVTAADPTGMDFFRRIQGIKPLESSRGNEGLFARIAAHYPEGTPMQAGRWQGALLETLCEFLGQLADDVPQLGQGSTEYAELLSWIQTNLSAQLSVNHLAQRLGVSRSALSKRFRRTMGISLKAHLQSELLHKARVLLAETTLTAQRIAEQLGYDDPYYFYRLFKRQTGCTPQSYRRSIRDMRF